MPGSYVDNFQRYLAEQGAAMYSQREEHAVTTIVACNPVANRIFSLALARTDFPVRALLFFSARGAMHNTEIRYFMVVW
ncbi:MAG: hypothetical protein ACR5LD_02810 [Symbiopectobacterium sp.]